MKKYLLLCIVAILIYSCGGNSTSDYYYTNPIPIEYNKPGNFPQRSGNFSYLSYEGDKIEFSNISPSFYAGSLFSDGLALVEMTDVNKREESNRAFINEKGEIVLSLKDYNVSLYHGCSAFWNGYAIIPSIVNNQTGQFEYLVVNTKGDIVTKLPTVSGKGHALTPASPFIDGYISMSEEYTYANILYNLKGEECLTVENGGSPLQFGQITTYKRVNGETKYGTINIKGETVVPFNFSEYIRYNVEGYAITKNENDELCIINSKGKIVVEPGLFEKLEYHGNGVYRGILKDQEDLHYRWYDLKGNTVKVNGSEINDLKNSFDKNGLFLLNVPRKDNKYYALSQIKKGYTGLSLSIIDSSTQNDILNAGGVLYTAQYIDGDIVVWDELRDFYLYGDPYTVPSRIKEKDSILF